MTKPRIVQFYKCGHRFHANLTLEQIAFKRYWCEKNLAKMQLLLIIIRCDCCNLFAISIYLESSDFRKQKFSKSITENLKFKMQHTNLCVFSFKLTLQICTWNFKCRFFVKLKVLFAIYNANLPFLITPNHRTKNAFIIHLFVKIVITRFIMKQKDDWWPWKLFSVTIVELLLRSLALTMQSREKEISYFPFIPLSNEK